MGALAEEGGQLSLLEKLGYGAGDTASHFVWDMVGFWLLVYYTDTLGISAAAAGTIMLVARIWDMVSDPLMTAYTAINLPYSSLSGVMTSDSSERTGLNQYRFVFAFGGQLLVSGAALYLVGWLGGGDSALGFQRTLVLFAVLSVLLFGVTSSTTRERVEPPASQKSDLGQDVRNLLRTRPWLVLFGVGVLSFTLFALQSGVTAFYFKYFIGDAEGAQPFNVVGTVALMAAIPLARPLARRFGNRNLFMGCSALTGVAYLLMFLARPGQLWQGAFGYVANAVQTEQAVTGIVLMMTVIPGILFIAGGALFFLYNLDADTARRMATDLAERRAARES